MYQFSYAEVAGESTEERRDSERQALNRSIELLRLANDAGPRSREAIEALSFVRNLWATLVEDLGSPENRLPQALRADLISVGLWLMGETERIRKGESEDIAGLIEISEIISGGLN